MKKITQNFTEAYRKIDQQQQRRWFQLIAVAILISYLYAFFEWAFFVSQPAYSSVSINLLIKISVFLFSGLTIASISGILIFVLYFLYMIIPLPTLRKTLLAIGQGFLAFILACLFLLMIDNFTYTLFRVGIITSEGIWRGLYTILFLLLIFIAFRLISPLVQTLSDTAYKRGHWRFTLSVIVLFLSVGAVLTTFLTQKSVQGVQIQNQIDHSSRPNVLIIGSDGLSASHMSVYGYNRDTTLIINALATESMVGLNAFANANTSAGSVTSLLSGKLPSTTRVIYPPDILTGDDALQHLPGILKQEGYRTVEIAYPHFIDAYSLNFQNSFDIVNNRSQDNYPYLYLGWRIGGDYPIYFISITVERITTRLKHILFIQAMADPYSDITLGLGPTMLDQERVDEVISLLTTGSEPVFIHAHLVGTHGPYFNPRQRIYSSIDSLDEIGDIDSYDDSIIDFDRYIEEILTALEDSGRLNDTILVVYSDHGNDWSYDRLPLIFRFPNGQFSRQIQENTQNLDIAPTLLDYLHLPIPDWMEGDSLLDVKIDQTRRIFAFGLRYEASGVPQEWQYLDSSVTTPPFNQIATMRMLVCNHFYQVDLTNNTWSDGIVADHTAPCGSAALPSLEEAKVEMINHLIEKGFEPSTVVK